MITSGMLENLYDNIIIKEQLTTKMLNSLEFSSYDINNLIEDGVIKRVKRGLYKIVNNDNIYRYWMLRFYECVNKKDYLCAISFLDRLLICNDTFLSDYNTYLYLISYLTKLPVEYKEYVDSLNISDLYLISDLHECGNISLENKIRKLIFKQDFNNIIGKIEVKDLIIKTLLTDVIILRKEKDKVIKELINSKKYRELDEYLNSMNIIDHKYNLIYEIVRNYVGILEDKVYLNEYSLNVRTSELNIENLICDKKYYAARNVYITNNKNSCDSNLGTVLDDICDIVRIKNNKRMVNFDKIVYAVSKNDIKLAVNLLHNYLEYTKLSYYETLIISLIKIDILDNDFNLSNTRRVMNEILDETFVFDLDFYKSALNYALDNKLFKYAKECMNIIDFYEFNENYNRESYFKEKVNYLRENKGMVLIDDVSNSELDQLMILAYLEEDIDASYIYYNDKKMVMLRHKRQNTENSNDDLKNIARQGFDCYHNQDYEGCINFFLEFLQIAKEPRDIHYAKLGFSYIRTGEVSLGIDYLKVAMYLSGDIWDYSDYIGKLTEKYENTEYLIDMIDYEGIRVRNLLKK